MYKFSYFTQRANEVLNYAIKAAEDFGHNYIGSEHILLGLLKTDGGVAVNMLEEKGVTAEDIENLIKEYIGEGMQTKLTPDDFTPRTKRVLDVAFQCHGMRPSSFAFSVSSVRDRRHSLPRSGAFTVTCLLCHK